MRSFNGRPIYGIRERKKTTTKPECTAFLNILNDWNRRRRREMGQDHEKIEEAKKKQHNGYARNEIYMCFSCKKQPT